MTMHQRFAAHRAQQRPRGGLGCRRAHRTTAACALLALLLPTGAAHAASDPVYQVVGPDGRVSISNHNQSGVAKLMLSADSEAIWSFRQRFRAASSEPVHGGTRIGEPVHGSTRLRGTAMRRAYGEYGAMVDSAAGRAGLNADLVRAVVFVESGFQPAARSSAGAVGLMQLIPATAARFGLHDPTNPERNLDAGTRYLAWLLRRFRGDVRLALAGYNAGEGAVIKHGYRIPPYAETQAYVPAVLSAWRTFSEQSAQASTHGTGSAVLVRAGSP